MFNVMELQRLITMVIMTMQCTGGRESDAVASFSGNDEIDRNSSCASSTSTRTA